MNNKLDLNEQWVLITGASSGIGLEMSLVLAKKYNSNLILIARREDNLKSLQQKIISTTKVKVEYFCIDLSDIKTTTVKLSDILIKYNPKAVILNAGQTYLGRHFDISTETKTSILNTNLFSIIESIEIISKFYESKNTEGGLLLIASMASFHPTSYQSLYSATKSFIYNFALALSHEIQNKKFTITIFAPGGVKTEMTNISKFKKLEKYMDSAPYIAEMAIKALVARKKIEIPGIINKISHFFLQVLPKNFTSKIIAKNYLNSLYD